MCLVRSVALWKETFHTNNCLISTQNWKESLLAIICKQVLFPQNAFFSHCGVVIKPSTLKVSEYTLHYLEWSWVHLDRTALELECSFYTVKCSCDVHE